MKKKLYLCLILLFLGIVLFSVILPKQSYAQSCGVCDGSTGGKSCPGRDGNPYVMPAFTHSCWTPPYNGVDDCNTCCNPGIVDAPCTLVGGGGTGNDPYQDPYNDPYNDPYLANFNVLGIGARDRSGNTPSYFQTGDPIYVTTTITNDGNASPCCATRHGLYKSQTNFDNGTASMYIDSSSSWPPGFTPLYESWPTGTRKGQFTTDSFTQTSAGTYRLWVAADYDNRVAEFDSNDNYAYATYDVYARLYGSVCWSKDEDTQCDAGEPGVQGTRISMDRDTDQNGSYETYIGSHTTASNGDYDFGYRQGAGYQLTFSSNSWRSASSNPRTTTLGPDTRIRFALIPTYDLSGYIFIDDNRDGTKDPGETTGYSGATVTLTGPTGEGGTTTTDATGRYSFPNRKRGNYTVTLTVPTDYKAYPNGDNTRTITIPLNSTQNGWTADIGINRVYSLTGRVYADADKDGSYNTTNDLAINNQLVSVSGQNTGSARTTTSGRFSIDNLEPGDYQLTTTPPNDYTLLTTLPIAVTIVDANVNRNIRFFGKYIISGSVFVDTDDSQRKNGSEANYAADPGILMSNYPSGAPNPFITNNLDGSYTLTGLISGQYTVRYPNLPTGYIMNHPRNGPPASFVAPVGSVCAEATPSPGGTCSNGNLIDLNFAIKRGLPWWQAYGMDVRFDTGLNNPVPPSPDSSCTGGYAMLPGSSSTPGVGFTGDTPANLWQGNVSSNGWLVGGASYPETFMPSNGTLIQTSYGYLQSIMKQSNITPINLNTVCTLNNCTLPGALANGIYQADSAVTLNSFTAGANRDIIILVNGDLTLKGTLSVPTTSTVFYSVSGSITVDPSLGRTAACPGPAIGSGNLEGFFSADQSFNVPSGSASNPKTADCSASPSPIPDKQLNVQGAIVVRAGGVSGSFSNERDLCTDNINFPSFTIRERPDMILNSPEFLRVPNFIWQEVAP